MDWASVDMGGRSIEIIDWKGSSAKPRPYILYLNDLAYKALEGLREVTGGEGGIYLFSESYVPKKFREYSAFSGWKVSYDGLRSTCTSLMKRNIDFRAIGMDRDDVKRVQHHKIEGIQESNYDKNDYWVNKKVLLDRWGKYLESIGVWA